MKKLDNWFTVEVTVRFISCPGKLRFWKDFKNVVDVMAIVPYYVTLFNVNYHNVCCVITSPSFRAM